MSHGQCRRHGARSSPANQFPQGPREAMPLHCVGHREGRDLLRISYIRRFQLVRLAPKDCLPAVIHGGEG